MKPFTVAVEIDLPRAQVIERFDDPQNLFKWQKGLLRIEPISGVPGQPGAKMRLVYENRGRTMELIETVTERKLPDVFSGVYEWHHGRNTLHNRFIEVGPNRTRWESTCEYHFTALLPKVMGFLAPGMFRRQSHGFLEGFKAFCEQGRDVRQEG